MGSARSHRGAGKKEGEMNSFDGSTIESTIFLRT